MRRSQRALWPVFLRNLHGVGSLFRHHNPGLSMRDFEVAKKTPDPFGAAANHHASTQSTYLRHDLKPNGSIIVHACKERLNF